MALKEIQKHVDDWISHYEEGYWPLHKMFTQLSEEIGELADEVLRASSLPVFENLEYLIVLQKAKELGREARMVMDRSGRKRKKETNKKSSVTEEVADIQFVITCMMNLQKVDMDLAFIEMMNKKRYGRDKDRFKKKGEN